MSKPYRLTQQHLKNNTHKLNRFKYVRIWSKQWKLWWRANGAGYTDKIEEAGMYGIWDAWGRISDCGPEEGIVLESD